MAHTNFNTILFNGLISRLKAFNYNVSVEHVLDVQSIFLSLSLSEIKLEDLKYLLTPLLAKSKEEQQDIYKIIDRYIEERTRPAYPETFSVKRPRLQPPPRRVAPPVKNDAEFKVVISTVAAIFLLAICVFLYRQKHRITPLDLPEITAKADTTREDSVPKIPAANNTAKLIPPVTGSFNNTGFTIQSLHAVEAKEKNINAQLSIILGLIAGVILSFAVFRAKETEYVAGTGSDNKAAPKSSDDAAGAANPSVAAEEKAAAVKLPVLLKFSSNNHIIRDDKYAAFIKKNIKKTGAGNVPAFNIAESIVSSAESGGFYSVVYSYSKEQRKYLFLVEEHYAGSHIVNLFNSFIQNLVSDGAYIEKYSYSTSIFTVHDDNGNNHKLKDLAYARPEFNLVILGDGHQLIDPATAMADERIMALLRAWQSRALVTSVALRDWNFTESQLQKNRFAVVPAETGAVDLLIKSISGKQDLGRKAILKQLHANYSVKNAQFETAAGIDKYLGNKHLFQFVCSLALCPGLNWPITLALYDALVKKNAEADVAAAGDYNTLLKIARMPFLNAPVLIDPLRLSLLQSIDKKTEITARKTIHAALQAAKTSVPVNSREYTELLEQVLLNEFFLYASDRKEFKKYAPSKKNILPYWRGLNDPVLKNYYGSGNAKIMPVKGAGQHLTVEGFMVKERQREVRKVTFLRAALTVLPALLIYLFLIIFKPPYANPKGSEMYGQNPVTIIFKKDSCSRAISVVKLSGNNINTFEMRLDSATTKDTVLYNMDYDAPVTLQYKYNGAEKISTIDCRDSLYIITLVNCR